MGVIDWVAMGKALGQLAEHTSAPIFLVDVEKTKELRDAAKLELDALVAENKAAQRGDVDRVLRIAELKVVVDNYTSAIDGAADGALSMDDPVIKEKVLETTNIFLGAVGEYLAKSKSAGADKLRTMFLLLVDKDTSTGVLKFLRHFTLEVHPDKPGGNRDIFECYLSIKTLLGRYDGDLINELREAERWDYVVYAASVVKAKMMSKLGIQVRDELIAHVRHTCRTTIMRECASQMIDYTLGFDSGEVSEIDYVGPDSGDEVEMYMEVFGIANAILGADVEQDVQFVEQDGQSVEEDVQIVEQVEQSMEGHEEQYPRVMDGRQWVLDEECRPIKRRRRVSIKLVELI